MVLSTDNPITVNYIYWLSNRNTDSSEYYRTTKIVRELMGTAAYSYQYDKLGNITVIKEGQRDGNTNNGKGMTEKVSYEYDALSQLTRENNKYLNQTITYTYDNGGNLTQKTIYPYTTASSIIGTATSTKKYTYGNSTWKDLLTSYDGKSITYDSIGNPTSYLGYALEWNGRQLSSLKGNGVTASYKYDADGLRSYKKVGNVESTYQYLGDKLVYEKRGDLELRFCYNSFGDLAVIIHNSGGTNYYTYVVCNSRGDVVDLYSGSGALKAHYTYDSWGNVISITDGNGKEITSSTNIAIQNPIRYREYYYDSETGMYYVASRYYDPQVGRFISADTIDLLVATPMALTDENLYAYCDNNPVVGADFGGQLWNFAIGAGAGAIFGGLSAAITGSNVLVGVASGALSGALAGGIVDLALWAGIGGFAALAVVGIAGGITSASCSYLGQRMNGVETKDVDYFSVSMDGLFGGIGTAFSFGLAGGGTSSAQTLKGIISQPQNKILSQVAKDTVDTLVVSFCSWLGSITHSQLMGLKCRKVFNK